MSRFCCPPPAQMEVHQDPRGIWNQESKAFFCRLFDKGAKKLHFGHTTEGYLDHPTPNLPAIKPCQYPFGVRKQSLPAIPGSGMLWTQSISAPTSPSAGNTAPLEPVGTLSPGGSSQPATPSTSLKSCPLFRFFLDPVRYSVGPRSRQALRGWNGRVSWESFSSQPLIFRPLSWTSNGGGVAQRCCGREGPALTDAIVAAAQSALELVDVSRFQPQATGHPHPQPIP